MALLAETDAQGGVGVAEAIRRQLAETNFPGVGGVTANLGVAEHRLGDPP